MAKEFNRSHRVADAIQRDLSLCIQQEIRDPRVGMVNVNSVDVARDLSFAKIYVTFLAHDNEAEAKEALGALNKAAGFLRSYLAKANEMRTVPKLRFMFDKSVSNGQHLSALITKAVAEDSANQAADNTNTGGTTTDSDEVS